MQKAELKSLLPVALRVKLWLVLLSLFISWSMWQQPESSCCCRKMPVIASALCDCGPQLCSCPPSDEERTLSPLAFSPIVLAPVTSLPRRAVEGAGRVAQAYRSPRLNAPPSTECRPRAPPSVLG